MWGSEHNVEEARHLEAVRLGKTGQRKHGAGLYLLRGRHMAEGTQFVILPSGGNIGDCSSEDKEEFCERQSSQSKT